MSGPDTARPPFTVLHVCTGNICRSPMAERLLTARLADAVRAASGDVDPADLLLSHSCGTGGWHAGEPMNPPAARQVLDRGGDPTGFAARQLHGEHIDSADLVLTATGEQASYVTALRPDAGHRTFALLEFGRLVPEVDTAALPAADLAPPAVLARGIAVVDAVDKLRAGTEPGPEDDLDDPWGLGDRFFTRIADDIETCLRRLVRVLTGS